MQIQNFLQINVRVYLSILLCEKPTRSFSKLPKCARILKCTMSQSKDQDIFIFIFNI